MKGFQELWEELRKEGKQTAKYPYDKVISFVFRYYPKHLKKSEVCILEVGCGAGNNLWALAMEGFKVYGLDGSQTAIERAKEIFKTLGLEADLRVGDFTEKLPYNEGTFDIAIDRGSITCVDYEEAKKTISEVHRVLKSGGYFFFNPYAQTHTSYVTSTHRLNERFVLTEKGSIAGTGYVCFYSKEDVREILKEGWEIVELRELSVQDHISGNVHSEWEVVVRKL